MKGKRSAIFDCRIKYISLLLIPNRQSPMSHSTFLSALGAALFLGSFTMPAQTPSPPKAPFLAPSAGNAHWIIEVQGVPGKPTTSAPKAPAAPKVPATGSSGRVLIQVDMTVTKDLRRQIKKWANGTQTEKWWKGDYCLLKEPDFDTIFIFSWDSLILSEKSYQEFAATDFPELRWVGADTFLEWATVDDIPVAIYGQQQSEVDKANPASNEFLRELVEQRTGKKLDVSKPEPSRPTSRDGYAKLAWIDGHSKRPIALESAHERWDYISSERPTPQIELPLSFLQAIGRYFEAANAQKMNVKP